MRQPSPADRQPSAPRLSPTAPPLLLPHRCPATQGPHTVFTAMRHHPWLHCCLPLCWPPGEAFRQYCGHLGGRVTHPEMPLGPLPAAPTSQALPAQAFPLPGASLDTPSAQDVWAQGLWGRPGLRPPPHARWAHPTQRPAPRSLPGLQGNKMASQDVCPQTMAGVGSHG